MIKLKNTLFSFTLFAFAFVAVADNPGEEVVNDTADQVVEETVESEVVSEMSLLIIMKLLQNLMMGL